MKLGGKILILILGIGIIMWGSLKIFKDDYKNKPSKTTKPSEKENDNPRENISTESKVKISMVGDFLFEEPFYEALRNGDDKERYFSLVKDYFQNDDLSIGNMEVVIGNDELETSGVGYNFCAPKSIGELVATLDMEVLVTANNHAFDRGSAGVISTLDFFNDNTDIMPVGTFKNINDKERLNILEINGIKIGILAYTMSTNVKPSDSELFMVSYYKEPTASDITESDKLRIKKEVTTLKEQVDVVIVAMHWGNEYTFEINSAQKELAAYLNSLGVSMIVGSHSHNIQPIEWIGDEHKTLVYYSLGNFVSADNYIARTNETFNNAYQFGLLAEAEIIKKNDTIQIKSIGTEPIINYYDTNLRNFLLVPFSKYTSELELSHYRYNSNLNKEFITQIYEEVIDEEFR